MDICPFGVLGSSFLVPRPHFPLAQKAAVELQKSPVVVIGPFGSGKTSTLRYMASELDRKGALTTFSDLSYQATPAQIRKYLRREILEAHSDRSRSRLIQRYGDERGILLLDEVTEVVPPPLLEEMMACGIRLVLGMQDFIWRENGPLASSLRGSLTIDITPTPQGMAGLLYALGKDPKSDKRRITRKAAAIMGSFAWQVSHDCRFREDCCAYEYPYNSGMLNEYIGYSRSDFQRLAVVLANDAWARAQKEGRDVVMVRDVDKLKNPERLKFSTAAYERSIILERGR